MDYRNTYLETQITTATPQKLRLMLIEGAIRFAQQAINAWEEGRGEDGLSALMRSQAVVAELLGSVREDGTPITRQVIDIYAFLALELHAAEMDADAQRIAGVIRVLQEDRQTWQELCQQMPEAPQPVASEYSQASEILAPRRVEASFSAGYSPPQVNFPSTGASSGFSLEV
ncbi:flagellar export chaperone FliS [Anatilimnocola floriformis]|uniref:flagellar export chaperone FliS n=1 Tax=Anatilimnocola floriformis TaxID=2948575 RepID=UPI0020C583F0|nr:flagellar export chaperone FliS [Anatilimnocola floriformis]